MKFSIEPRQGYLHATLYERRTAEDMREFLLALHAASKEHACGKALISIRRSRPMYRAEDYGLNGYANALVTPCCQLALVGDTAEVRAAHEHVETVARQQGIDVRAFRDEAAARAWLGGVAAPERRYKFARIVIAGSPADAGVYTLWDDEELVYYGRAEGGEATIRSRLLEHLRAGMNATHYAWELCRDPAAREAELLAEHERAHGRLPKLNAKG